MFFFLFALYIKQIKAFQLILWNLISLSHLTSLTFEMQLQPPTLALLDLNQHFILYPTKNQGMAMAIWRQLRPLPLRGWQSCLWALTEASLVVQEAKLTFHCSHSLSFHQTTAKLSSHTKASILCPLLGFNFYQINVLENPDILFNSSPLLEAATLLSMATNYDPPSLLLLTGLLKRSANVPNFYFTIFSTKINS
jgi:hypothetical protein